MVNILGLSIDKTGKIQIVLKQDVFVLVSPVYMHPVKWVQVPFEALRVLNTCAWLA